MEYGDGLIWGESLEGTGTLYVGEDLMWLCVGVEVSRGEDEVVKGALFLVVAEED
jgi:hypothetical protein